VGDVEGDRDGSGGGDQGPGIPGVTPGVSAQVAPEDDQAGGGVKESTSSGADQARVGGKAAVSMAKARMASKETTSARAAMASTSAVRAMTRATRMAASSRTARSDCDGAAGAVVGAGIG
jgi:hypothetical protein